MAPAVPTFPRAVLPPRVRLGGRRLLPPTLGHCLLLERAGSPFAPFGAAVREPTAGDVALAWFLLSRPWTVARDTVDGRLATGALWLFAVLRAGREQADAAALAGWLEEQSALPEHTTLLAGEGRRGAPTVLIYALRLLELGAGTWPGVLGVSLAEAAWLHLASYETGGALRLKEPGEVAAEAAAAEPVNAARLERWAAHNAARTAAGRSFDPARDSPATFDRQPPALP